MKRCNTLLVPVLAVLALSLPMDGSHATAAPGPLAPSDPEVVLIDYGAPGYRYSEVPHGAGAGFEAPSFDDAGFKVGAAGFGTPEGKCPLNGPKTVKTAWNLDTDLLLRRPFDLPPKARKVIVRLAIDNDVQVWVNGHDISGGMKTHEGCAKRDSFTFVARAEHLVRGRNLLAVRARDRGVLAYVDVKVVGVVYTTDR